jgi:dTMP kinase
MIKIEFEGTDGAGKTTGLKYFIEQAKKKGLSVVETREVGNPHVPACVKLREFVLDPASNLTGEAMECIFAAMRFENDAWLQKLQAQDGKGPDFVVSDRGMLSHLAYTDHNVSIEFSERFYIENALQMTSGPDVVIYFAVNTETALKRRQKRGSGMDVIEMKGVGYQEKVRESFLKYIDDMTESGSPCAIFEVDANEDIEGVQAQLDEVLENILTICS